MTAVWQTGIGLPAPTGTGVLSPLPRHRSISSPPVGLLPGDILLCSPHAADFRQRAIQHAQYAAFAAADACYTHVALYTGGHVVDATPMHQVCERDWRGPFDQMHVRARRFIGISDAQRLQLCHFARSLLPMPYNYAGAGVAGALLYATRSSPVTRAWQDLMHRLRSTGKSKPSDPGAMHAAHCGELIDAIFLRTLGHSVVDGQALLPIPAAFSADTRLFADANPSW